MTRCLRCGEPARPGHVSAKNGSSFFTQQDWQILHSRHFCDPIGRRSRYERELARVERELAAIPNQDDERKAA